jgi:hypothetical protein
MGQPTTPSQKYFFWKPVFQEGFCVCESLQGFDDSHMLKRGVSIADVFPEDAFFAMDPDFPKDIKLGDGIRNRGGFIVISQRLRDLIGGAGVNSVEFLQVQIKNHKKRVASKEYFIVNPFDVCDAIDVNKSVIEWNQINPKIIATCKKLVLDPEKIPSQFKMFRLKFFPRHVVVREDLVDQIRAGDFTGVSFTAVEEFSGF